MQKYPPKILKSLESLAHSLTKILHTRLEPDWWSTEGAIPLQTLTRAVRKNLIYRVFAGVQIEANCAGLWVYDLHTI